MRIRAKSETKIPVNVQIFSNLVEMRFKPINQLGTQALSALKTQFTNSKKQYTQIYDPSTMALQADRKIEESQPRRLKYIVSLSAQHFIVGNENQIDMIGFGNIAHSYIDTDFYWSMTMKGPIQCVLVDTKRSIFLILSLGTLYFYQYSVKTKYPPEQIQTLLLRDGVRFIRFLKDSLLGVFYNSSYEIYNIQHLNLIKKKLEKSYQLDSTKKLLTIPPSIQDIINIFFEEKKQNKQSFILWCLELNFGSEQIKTRQLYRVYDVMNYVKGKLSIQNYTKEIICMSLNHQVMAIKNGYLIDTVNLRIKEQGQILKYLHPSTILHITKRNVEVYHFSINASVKPEKIILQSTDSIEISKYPQNAFYISVLRTHHNCFALFFEDSDKKKRQTRGEITYYFKVSQSTTVQNKIKSIFDSIGTPDNNPESLEEKYNMALKMGLSEKEIYLEIWNRSNRSSLEDYQYILATRDYKTIKTQIQKKLKKQSMVLRQILRIEESCHEINREKVQSIECNEENLQDFVMSHFLIKKLNLFKQISALERFSLLQNSSEDPNIPLESRQLKIDIQNYYFFKNLDMKSYLIEQINDMLINLKNNAKIIRIIIKNFKFVYRLVYKSILEQIITSTKQNLMNLLNQIPEILPYIHHDLNEQQLRQNLYDGIWGEIHQMQWQISLYPQIVQTIHNRQALSEFLNSVWFKRYWLTAHGMTTKTKQKIIEINEFNNSDHIFYFFISKLYQHSKNNKPLYYQTIQFLQQKYELFPSHLKNKGLLYQNLYIYYYNEEKSNPARLTYGQFLEWDDELLFKYYFDHQKVKKNSLLKQVKPIYEQSDANGSHLFNIGLFSYFYSNRSEISDLKFILNRINNEKAEFHQKNKGIYQVLIKSMQLKIRIGSPNCIPMDQVMIYIQNVPLDRQHEEITQELSMMESIKDEVGILEEIKIDMTVKQIIDNFEVVIFKIIKYKIQIRSILKIQSWDIFKQQSLKILKQTQKIKNKIYSIDNSSYTLLVYLSLIMQDESYIDKVALLLQDEQIHNFFDVQIKTIENIVLYMYKWKFSQSAKYIDNQNFLRRLLDLLPQDNQCRAYLQTELDIGLMFSSEYQPFQYPLGQNSYTPSIKVIQAIFRSQKEEFLLNFDLERLYSLLKKFDKAIYKQGKKNGESISLHKLYQILIVELLQKQMYREVIEYLYKILEIPSSIKNVGIVYIALYIYKMAKEFNEQSKKCLFKIFSIYFKEPLTILKIIDFVIKTRLTGLEQTKYLRDILEKQVIRHNFCIHNPIFSKEFTSHHQDPNSKKVIDYYHEFIKGKNKDFQWTSQYDIIYIFLCHSPYLLIKFLQLQREHLILKQVNQLIRQVIYRPIFNIKKSLEVAKRIFASLVLSSKQSGDIDLFISSFFAKSVTDDFQIPKLTNLNDIQTKWLKISRSYAKTLNKIKNAGPKEDIKEKRILKIKAAISNPHSVFQDHLEFQQEEQEGTYLITQKQQPSKKQKIGKICFNESEEKAKFFFRTEPIKDFLQKFNKQKNDELQQLEMIKRQSAPQIIINAKLGGKDKNYLAIRNQMIEHLYSHKVVTGSDYQDDAALRKQDEQFLDSYQKKNLNNSQASVRSGKSIRMSRNSGLLEVEQPIPKQQGQNSIQIVDHQIVGGDVPILKQTSIGSISQNQFEAQTDTFLKIKQQLIQSYNEEKIPKFEVTPLQNYLKSIEEEVISGDMNEIRRKKQHFLRNFLFYLYTEPQQTKNVYLKLIQQIGRKCPEAGVNNFFLQAYQRTYTTHQKHGLQMNIAQLLPLSGIFIKSKDIIQLYHEVEPYIIKKITDQNIFKLSKLIALGFRKSIVEQEILYNYLKNIMHEYINSEDENLEPLKQKIKSIQHKLQVQVAIDKAQELFQELPVGKKRDFLLNSYLETLKNRGYQTASRSLQAKIS